MSPSSLRRVLGTLSAAALLAPAVVISAGTPASANTPSDVASLALANVGKGAGYCSTVNSSPNSLGGSAFNGSCQGYNGVPEYWCADFAKWVWQNSGLNVTGLTAAADSFVSAASSNGSTVHTDSGYRPQLGDAAVYGGHHVGLVTAVKSDGSIQLTNGDWGGTGGQGEVVFAQTARVVNETVSAGQVPVGSYQSSMNYTVTAYVTPSGYTSRSTSPVSFDATGYHIAFVDPNGNLANDWVANGVWNGPAGAGGVARPDSPVVMDKQADHLFFIDTNGNVANDWIANGAWNGPGLTGGKARPGSPIVTNAAGTVVSFIDTNGNVANDWFNNGVWNGPAGTGGQARADSPLAVDANNDHIFFIDTNGNVANDWIANGVWNGPAPIGGQARPGSGLTTN
ncbi:CHAP domain-containing protein, partial [Kitasatospora sp. NPDC059648]|uniref:CHAP domain-containing protein n=1 Tax=Kitasatospora sp. NPDC059648 TaxID=3346894 RepID=UPI0036760993